METKKCNGCGKEKPLTREFFGQYKNKRNGEVRIGFRNICRTCMANHSREHFNANREQAAERQSRRLSREQTQSASYDPSISVWLREKLGDRCRYCNEALEGDGEIDHITPVGRGGSGKRENLTLACKSCNRSKLAKTLTEFLDWRIERDLPIRLDAPQYEHPDIPKSASQRRSYR